MKKGIILEINERFLTLLTPEGEFLRARKFNSQYQIGQEIDFFPVVEEEGKKPSFLNYFQNLKGKVIFVAALILILTISSVFPFYGKNEVYAYMSIDINPSIELGVNEKFQVIEIVPYNEAGKKIIANINNWKKKDIQVLTNEILQEIKVQGYMKTSQEIVIATVYTNEGFQDQNKRWEEEIAEIKTVINDENLELKVVEGSKTDRDQAKEMGLTTGLYKQEQLKASIPQTQDNEIPGTKEQFKKEKVDNPQMTNSPLPPGHQKKDRDSEGANEKFKENKRDPKKEYPPGLGKKEDNKEKEPSPSLENQHVKKDDQNSQKEKYNHKENRKEKNNKDKEDKEDKVKEKKDKDKENKDKDKEDKDKDKVKDKEDKEDKDNKYKDNKERHP